MKERSLIKLAVWLPAGFALLVVFAAGLYLGHTSGALADPAPGVVGQDEGRPEKVDFSLFWQAWKLIDQKYVTDNGNTTTTAVVSDQEKVYGAIAGLVQSLGDPYSIFLPPEENKKFEEEISGNFSGVGMEIGTKAGVLTVIAPLSGSPASRAGVLAGDKILRIGETLTVGLSADEAVNLIRGPAGTTVNLTLSRGEDDKAKVVELAIKREVITIPTIEAKLLPEGVFLIRLFNFSAISANLFRDALRQFVLSGSDKLILDLRGNPGGFLEASVEMASWFLPAGRVVLVEKHGEGSEDKTYRSHGYDIFNDQLKMAILVDRGSASASEILAGALREHGVARLVGEKTFGKGSVQELVPLPDNSSLKLTIAKWYTPQGHSISQNGLVPDLEVKMEETDLTAGRDPQLAAAVDLLLKK